MKNEKKLRRATATPRGATTAHGGAVPTGHGWTFLSNHTHVLLCLAGDPQVRLREVASRVGITERAVQKIVADLEGSGVVSRTRSGRRNHYEINSSQPLRHPVEAHRTVGDLLDMVIGARR